MTSYEYKTEVLTSMVGRDKLRVDDLEDVLQKHGAEGWELASLNLDADSAASATVTCSSSSAQSSPPNPRQHP